MGTGVGYNEVAGTRRTILSPYVPTGAVTFDVPAGHVFSIGDNVIIYKTPNDNWINLLNMAQYGWTASGYKVNNERKITRVEGNTVTIDIPLCDPIETELGGAQIFKVNTVGRVSNCGVENIRFESVYTSNTDNSHAWTSIVLSRAENCWVKDIITKYFVFACVDITAQSVFNTVQDCACIDPKSQTIGGLKYGFNLESFSPCNLFNRCVGWGNRHDFATSSKVPGPNVFLDCYADSTCDDAGPHHRWATGTLYDNIRAGQIRARNRGATGPNHGWAGAQIVFWNCSSYKTDIWVSSPPCARNFGIGCTGLKQIGEGYWESWGTPVLPRSLYLQQLEERFGNQTMAKVTSQSQRDGSIWAELKNRVDQVVSQPNVQIPTPISSTYDIEDKNNITITQTNDHHINIETINNVQHVEIFDISGRKVLSVRQPRNNKIFLANVKTGLYIIKISTSSQNYTNKIFIQI